MPGLGVSTIPRALKHHPGIFETTRQKVAGPDIPVIFSTRYPVGGTHKVYLADERAGRIGAGWIYVNGRLISHPIQVI